MIYFIAYVVQAVWGYWFQGFKRTLNTAHIPVNFPEYSAATHEIKHWDKWEWPMHFGIDITLNTVMVYIPVIDTRHGVPQFSLEWISNCLFYL